jgi:uncharacterized protein
VEGDESPMQEIALLIERATAARVAQADKKDAFAEIVRRFQDLAYGCAYAMLGDFHLAQDAAQEAFLAAWRGLDQLRRPEAFPGWFKRVVVTQCTRITRAKGYSTLRLSEVPDLPMVDGDPQASYDRAEQRDEVLAALRALPEHERLAATLFYIGDYGQAEIAAFLEVPVGTVKKRLFSARQRLRERMLPMVRETLQEQRPSRDEQFAETVARFTEALDAFVARVKQDRYVIAAILYGSLSHDAVWRKSDIDIILVGRDERVHKSFALVENGVNIHAMLVPRSKFKQMIEGTLQGSFMHSAFALSTLLYTTDNSIRALYDNARLIGERDQRLRLMGATAAAIGTLAKAEKWLETRRDVAYSFLWTMFTIWRLAEIEVLLHGELTTREVLPHALKLNGDFFNVVYTDLIQQPKDESTMRQTLAAINAYLDDRLSVLCAPLLEYLRAEGGIRTQTELDDYFGKQLPDEGSINALCEWLSDKGIIQKVSAPVRLTHKSQVTLDEAAFYFDD